MKKYFYYFTALIYWIINAPFFKQLGFGSRFVKPLRLSRSHIKCGRNVYGWKHCRIEAVIGYNDKIFDPLIEFEDGVSLQQGAHITCANRIHIGKNTACAANVTITDMHHLYQDITIPIKKQDIEVKSVYIGEDCNICNNCVILPGANIGNHVTVAANTIVNGCIPSFCVVTGGGHLYKIVKRYDFGRNEWRKTTSDGSFIEDDLKEQDHQNA